MYIYICIYQIKELAGNIKKKSISVLYIYLFFLFSLSYIDRTDFYQKHDTAVNGQISSGNLFMNNSKC